jgi:hypothetical protein
MSDATIQSIIKLINIYNNPKELISLVETHDLNNKEVLYYIHKYDLSIILNSAIFDQYINDKWEGRVRVSGSILNLSSPMIMFNNDLDLMTQPMFIMTLYTQMLNYSENLKLIHYWGFSAFKYSMRYRFEIESIFTFIITMSFQVYISEFTVLIHMTNKEMNDVSTMKTTGVSMQKIHIEQERIEADVALGVVKFKEALYVSCLYLMIPVDKLVREFFYLKTKRNPAAKDVTFVIDILLFISVTVILLIYFELSKPNLDNPYTMGELDEFTSD